MMAMERLPLTGYFFLIFICAVLLFSSGCGSKSYDIEDIEEEESEIPYTYTEPEIKNEIEKQKEEVKTEETVTQPLTENINTRYTIQIGAFFSENNAMDFMRYAKTNLQYEIFYKLTEGLYKVRLGNFNTRSEALTLLGNIQSLGYPDAFVTELDK